MQLWIKDKSFLYLIPEPTSHWYLEHKPKNTTLYISGISLYWLVNNGYKRKY